MIEIEEILAKIKDLKYEQKELTRKAAEIILGFDGTLAEAMEQGLVKLNFPAPSWLLSTDKKQITFLTSASHKTAGKKVRK